MCTPYPPRTLQMEDYGGSPLQHQGSNSAIYHGNPDVYNNNNNEGAHYNSAHAGSYDHYAGGAGSGGDEDWRGKYK